MQNYTEKPNLGKKASIDVQFNWIFVLIIGALIIVFFISVMNTSVKNSTKATYQSLSTQLENLLSQVESDEGNSRTIFSPGLVVNVECQSFDLEKSSSTEDITYTTLFSPDTLKGKELVAYTSKFEMPYPAGNFIFLTSREVRYNFVNDTTCGVNNQCQTMIKALINLLPVNSTMQIVKNASDVEGNNYYKERFIFFSHDLTSELIDESLDYLKDSDVTAVNIETLNLNYGNITYYRRDGNSFEKEVKPTNQYLGVKMLEGAILSDYSVYDCNKIKALLKFSMVTSVYLNRTEEFKREYDKYEVGSSEYLCHLAYSSINLKSSVLQKETYVYLQTIYNTAQNLKKVNDQSLLNSCPPIY